jgi:hypothetical protein
MEEKKLLKHKEKSREIEHVLQTNADIFVKY